MPTKKQPTKPGPAPKAAPYVLNVSKYHRHIVGIDPDRSEAHGVQVNTDTRVDVYDVLRAFNVSDPARQHAIKKLLAAGQRGEKSEAQDLEEARQSVVRAQELLANYGE